MERATSFWIGDFLVGNRPMGYASREVEIHQNAP
jgi:hypothetical protein